MPDLQTLQNKALLWDLSYVRHNSLQSLAKDGSSSAYRPGKLIFIRVETVDECKDLKVIISKNYLKKSNSSINTFL